MPQPASRNVLKRKVSESIYSYKEINMLLT